MRRRGVKASQSDFSPDDLPNLVQWLDASDLTTLWQESSRTTQVSADSDPVGAWDDKSGLGNHVTGGFRPDYNFSSSLYFDNTTFLSTSGNIISQADPKTVYLVFNPDANSNRDTVYEPASINSAHKRFSITSELSVRRHSSVQVFADAPTIGSQNVVTITDEGLLVTGINARINGVATTASSTNANNAIEDLSGNCFVGKMQAGNNYKGYLSEVLTYSEIHGSSNIADIESYLSDKWGVSI